MTNGPRPVAAKASGSLLRTLADNSDAGSVATRMRRRRFQVFQSLLETLNGHIEILDIGGTQQFWDLMLQGQAPNIRVTLLNIEHQQTSGSQFVSAVGDARSMPQYGQASYDVIFSNSVIEHVGDYENQRRMADEIQRVGKRFFVQTPNKRFPLEPHFLFPFFQYLPMPARAWLVNRFDVGWYRRIPDRDRAREEVESIQLLTRKRFAALFPGATIREEKFFGLTKSFVAIGGW